MNRTTISVREAKAAAGAWVAEQGAALAGFAGAYLAGSAGWLPDDAPLPAASDVDVMVVLTEPEPPVKPGKLLYRSTLLDVTLLSRDLLATPEMVLGDYHLASGLRAPAIVADPTGHLTALQAAVAANFTRREWVTRRVEQATDRVRAGLRRVSAGMPPHEQLIGWIFPTGVTTHILLTAGLRNPTVRKRYVAARELLAATGHSDLYEPLLDLLGAATIRQDRVAHHLETMTPLFDVAAAASRTPCFFATDISPAARPIAIDGSWELIERGDHREAMFWIAVTSARCLTILAADSPDATLARFAPDLQAIRVDLGVATFAEIQRRGRAVEAMLPRIRDVAESIMDRNPDIIGTSQINDR